MRANAAPDTRALRSRQRRALVRYPAAKPRDFLTVATPGSGKTAFALRVAGELLADGVVEQIPVVVLSRHPGLLQLRELRRELNTLVSIAHHRTASRTAGSTTSCAGSAAAQRSLRRRRTNSRRAHRSGARPGRLGPCSASSARCFSELSRWTESKGGNWICSRSCGGTADQS